MRDLAAFALGIGSLGALLLLVVALARAMR
jgi:hypothetical protein